MELLEFNVPIWLTLARASVAYLLVIAVMRFVPKRHASHLSPQDVVGAVVVGGLTVGAIIDRNSKPPDFLLAIAVILGWNYALDWLSDRFPELRRIIKEPPTRLIENGRIDAAALQREMLTQEELRAQLRKNGVTDVSKVRFAYLETNGEVTVIKNDQPDADPDHTTVAAEDELVNAKSG